MIRWLAFLLACIVAEILAVPVAFIAPLRPEWFGWFLTPDNPIDGDDGHQERWAGKPAYLCRVAWLIRNRAYGFKLGYIGCPARPYATEGDPTIKNRTEAKAGRFCLSAPPFWYIKIIRPIGFNYCLQIAFGWQLDAPISGRCLFMFSPRITSFYPRQEK